MLVSDFQREIIGGGAIAAALPAMTLGDDSGSGCKALLEFLGGQRLQDLVESAV